MRGRNARGEGAPAREVKGNRSRPQSNYPSPLACLPRAPSSFLRPVNAGVFQAPATHARLEREREQNQYFCRLTFIFEPAWFLRYHFSAIETEYHKKMTSQLLQLLTALSAFSLEMLYATYTLVVCLLLCEVSQNLQKNFEISWNFLRAVFLLVWVNYFQSRFSTSRTHPESFYHSLF